MRIIALIPARGGSKGIKRKNLRKLGDSTLVGFKVKQALKTNCNEVWVSSDDVEILNEAKKNGAQTIERPSTLAEDDTSTDSVILHAIKLLNLDSDDILVLLQPTSPLIQTESINLCISKLINNTQLSSVISVRESHPFMWSPSDSGNWDPKLHSRNKRLRRQEISEEGQETGGCYAMRIGDIHFQQA
jgi:N-acylneuraminate cytidylyltransferase